jgi:hypothetical protein
MSLQTAEQAGIVFKIKPVRLSLPYEAEKASHQENALFFGTLF